MVLGTRNEPWNPYVLIIGVPRDFLLRIPLSSGAPYEEESGEVIIGEVAAHQLGIQEGQALPLDGTEARVTGVFRTGSRLLDGGLIMDIPHAQRVLTQEGQPRQYSLAILPCRR